MGDCLPFHQGYYDFWDGYDDNPFNVGSWGWVEWEYGWLAARIDYAREIEPCQ